MADVIEVNCETDEVTTRPQTAEEIAAAEAAAAQFIAEETARQAAEKAKADAKAAAIVKLTALGLTADEVAALTA